MTDNEKTLAECLNHLLLHYISDIPKWRQKRVHEDTVVVEAVAALALIGYDFYCDKGPGWSRKSGQWVGVGNELE